MIEQRAPLAAALIDDKELTRYFGRRTYRGAIVKVPRINEGEWLCLLGDAAHSVLPAVGEGINSGPLLRYYCYNTTCLLAQEYKY
jgi:2-polyprenyl-6-methoxyphenol hydroxylase-like FAD-dependent oxidoreductase